jgi:hypothetical protein
MVTPAVADMNLYLVEKEGRRYVGECLHTEDSFFQLKNAYELVQMQAMSSTGPRLSHGFLPIGLDGPRSWAIRDPAGYRVLEDSDPLVRAYQEARARDAGITLANTMPAPLVKSGHK